MIRFRLNIKWNGKTRQNVMGLTFGSVTYWKSIFFFVTTLCESVEFNRREIQTILKLEVKVALLSVDGYSILLGNLLTLFSAGLILRMIKVILTHR